ncbi:hypothetical protein Droror1_Dr00001889 [Drosera rotundifolia]
MQRLFISIALVALLAPALSIVDEYARPLDSAKVDCEGTRVKRTIMVTKSRRSKYHKIQEAIDSVDALNTKWVKIYVMPGVYRERVQIPWNKTCILLEGHSRRITTVTNPTNSSTFLAAADNFVAKRITFVNTYRGGPGNALEVTGDKVSFYHCGFKGFQDTVWDALGRHYFHRCYIEGAVDFIYGNGQSVYEKVLINSTSTPGFITAQGRDGPDETTGFVFLSCYMAGTGPTFFGRAYRQYSRVILRKTYVANIIDPRGWDAWNYPNHVKDFTYAQVDCFGPGANTTGRVPWTKTLTKAEGKKFKVSTFIDQDGWLARQP